MCNDFGNRVSYREYAEEFAQLRIPLRFSPAAPNFEPRDEIWPTDSAPVVRGGPDGAEMIALRWGLSPGRSGGRAVINLRAEGRRFARGRCLVPASHYYEFTGTRSPKTRWRVTAAGQAWFAFAGLIGRAATPDGEVDAFALLTVAPGADVAPLHDRQPAIVPREHWAGWLGQDAPPDGLLAPAPSGTLAIAEAPRAR